jgi:hypothetical protein
MNKCMLLFILVFLISGCSTGSSPDPDLAPMSPLELTLGWSPDPGKAGEAVMLQVTIRQGEELVDDAGEVLFEIWRDGQDKHEMIQANPQGEGRYSTQIVFPNAGRYHVMYHVTARDMHSMDKAELIVEDK